MAQLSLYKSVYKSTGGTIYQLITPISISASTYNESGVNLIESLSSSIYSTGIYYVNINSNLYDAGTVYRIKWFIKYTNDAPLKTITSYFRVTSDANFSNQIYVEVQEYPMNIQISQSPIWIQVIKPTD